MTTTSIIGLLVSSALAISPATASAQATPSSTIAQVAENSVAASPSGASTAAPAAVAPAQARPADKKICKQLPSSYSRMTVRTCLTAKEWKQVEENDQ